MEIEVVHSTFRKPRQRLKTARSGPIRPKAKKVPVKKKKALSLSKLKKELDRVFSLHIRGTHEKKCYTCDMFYPSLQCGHFVSRQYLATRWDEMNCRPQCHTCNIRKHGNILEFEERLTREIGPERVQALKDKRKELWKLDRAFYETNIEKYKLLITPE